MSDISERVARILVDHLGAADEKIVPEALLHDDLGADSLDAVELAMALEEEFGIYISDESMTSLVFTVADLMDLTERAIEAEARKPAPIPVKAEGRKSWWWSRLGF